MVCFKKNNYLKKNINNSKNIIRLIKLVGSNNKLWLFVSIISNLFSSLSGYIGPYIIALIIDEISLKKNTITIFNYMVLLVTSSLAIHLVRTGLSYWNTILTNRTDEYLKIILYKSVMSTLYSNIESPSGQDFIRIASSTTLNIRSFLQQTISLFSSIASLLVSISIVSQMNIYLIFIILIFSIMRSLVNKIKVKKLVKLREISNRGERETAYFRKICENKDYGKEIRVLGIEDFLLSKLYRSIRKKQKKENSVASTNILARFLNTAIGTLETFLAYLFSAIYVINKVITIGDFTFYISCIEKLSAAWNEFIGNINKLDEIAIFSKEYIELTKNQYNATTSTKYIREFISSDINNKNFKFDIKFENVYFRYPGMKSYVLKNINFELKTGEKIAFVGENGAGKTTIVKLLCRLYQPTSGKILINDIPIDNIPFEDYCKYIGSVFQDYKIYAFSIKDNITMKEKADVDIESIINKAGLKTKIQSLKQGVNTNMSKLFDDDGIEFSGGESQKVAIARALFKQPLFYIFDEPTSSLDPISEYEIIEKLKEISIGKSAIYISHRLSSTKFVDKILVIDKGEIAECGNHEELIDTNGKYAEMFNLQAKNYD